MADLHWVLPIGDLRARGWTDREIERRVDSGLLHRIHHGVYAVGRPDLSFEGHCRAACLACGPGSAVSHISAGSDWGLRPAGLPIHISAPRGRKGHPGLFMHRPRSLPPVDIVERDGYSVTSVARTLLDMSPGQSVDRVGGWIHEAGVQGVLEVREIWAVLGRQPHHRGRVILERALRLEVAPTRSGLEKAFKDIVRRARVPKPNINEWLWSGTREEEVDFHFPTLHLIVETDGGRYHWSRWRRRRDAEKDARFRALGFTVWRIPELDISLTPDDVTAELRRLAATLGRPNPPHRWIS